MVRTRADYLSPGESGKGSPLLYYGARFVRGASIVGTILAVALVAYIFTRLSRVDYREHILA
ncbi:MAG: hypothetical protein ACR2H5_03155 [Ktedonobacteraceae bacterium]